MSDEKQENPADDLFYANPQRLIRLSYLGLIFGAMYELKIHQIFDELVPDFNYQGKISLAQAVMVAVARFAYSQDQNGLSLLEDFTQEMPVAEMLNDPDVSYRDLDESLLNAALQAVTDFGVTKMSTLAFSQLIQNSGYADKIRLLEPDFTAKRFYSTNEDDPQQFALLSSKENLFAIRRIPYFICDEVKHEPAITSPLQDSDDSDDIDYSQINTIFLTTEPKDVAIMQPVVSYTYSGKANNKLELTNLLSSTLPQLKDSYANLHYIAIGDYTQITPRNVALLQEHGMNFLARLPETKVRKLLKQANEGTLDFETFELNDQPTKAAWAGTMTFTDPDNKDESWTGRLLVASSMVISPTEKKQYEKEAAAERALCLSQIKELNNSKFNDLEAAQKAANKVLSKLEYYQPKLTITQSKTKAQANSKVLKADGTPKKPNSLQFSFKLTMTLDKDKMWQKLKTESFYALVTSDLDEQTSAQEVLSHYYGQHHVDSLWRDYKSVAMYFDKSYLQSPQHLQALMFLQSLALFVVNYLFNKILSFFQQADEKVLRNAFFPTTSPSWNTLRDRLHCFCPYLWCDFKAHTIELTASHSPQFFNKLMHYLGPQYFVFYDPDYYKQFEQQLEAQCRSVWSYNGTVQFVVDNEHEN